MDADSSSWEAAEGVPHIDDPFIQRFLSGRDSLVQREVAQRHGQTLGFISFHS